MDSPFVYNKFVSEGNFVPRNDEIDKICERIKQKEHTLIYEPPKSGKYSLIRQVFLRLKHEGYQFKTCSIDLFNVRTENELLKKIRTSLIESFSQTPQEKQKLEDDLMINHIREMVEYRDLVLNLPEALSLKFNTNIVLYFTEFQELLNFQTPDATISLLERVWLTHTSTTYLITGSKVNAMKDIFVNNKTFYRFAERVKLGPIDEKLFSEYIIKSFLKAGRVVSKDLASRLYRLTEGHPYYTQQLAEIAYYKTKGYMTEAILNEAFDDLTDLHSHHFREISGRLSLYQLNLLKSILDGVTKFSTQEVMEKYKFNSSANVVRLKDAVQKKEILEQEGENWYFLDPLFKSWLKRIYWNEV
ncbi:MAG: hypothetical protein PHU00_10010 [Bacteroidales bacterium]|nr:hypothetical protein [Bacteroidales bacterium]